PGEFDALVGGEQFDKVIVIDQSPIGRTPRSNPATYVKVWDDIRKLFTMLPDARRRGWKAGRFSFNVAGGRCGACEGHGSTRLDMDFLADVWVTCDVCGGSRFAKDTLEVRWKGKNVADILGMEVGEALEFFADAPDIARKLQTLHDVGLDYLHLGQPSPTLSGGEAQRVKLSRELGKRSTGSTLYILDEPTTGLHMHDVRQLIEVLERLVEAGNTVLVVEHNLDVVKRADHVIDLGPEGGGGGGQIVVAGTPEQIAKSKISETGKALKPVLAAANELAASGKPRRRVVKKSAAVTPAAVARAVKKSLAAIEKQSRDPGPPAIMVRGAAQHNLKKVDADLPRGAVTVCCGPSGSGKTSLAFDTLYAEGQRRYVESLSPYARQFVGQVPKPIFERIEGLAPAVAIEQRSTGSTPRSTVGTLTEMYDFFRVLAARLGKMHCPDCGVPLGIQTVDESVDRILTVPEGSRLLLLAPVELKVGQTPESFLAGLKAAGYVRLRIDGTTHRIDDNPPLDRKRKNRLEIVIDRITAKPSERSRIAQSVEAAFEAGGGTMLVARAVDDGHGNPLEEADWPVEVHSRFLACPECGQGFRPLEPREFSFNSPLGWCEVCDGLGTRTGVEHQALVRDASRTLFEGALDLWPDLASPVSRAMLEALCTATGLPGDVPLNELSGLQQRVLFEGTGEKWIPVPGPKSGGKVWFSFQFKGLEPACEDASRMVTALRSKVDAVMGEVPCSECGGSRLTPVASAVTLWGRTLDVWCRMPLGKLASELAAITITDQEKSIAGDLLRELTARATFLDEIGLEYLDMARPAGSLSGGEMQR
ncbi:MAG: excinuclease ABC subunit A, partial [Planctomycetia bacterium]|nr:excinuclease ABC subunit A [Planctomycetia bacterium]